MQHVFKIDRIRKELPGIGWTLALVSLLTAALFTMVWEWGLEHGSVVYLIPVVIAATTAETMPQRVAAITTGIR